MSGNGPQRSRVEIHDAKGRPVGRSGRDQRVVADLEPGTYLVVVVGAERQERGLSYTMSQGPIRNRRAP